MKKKRNGPGSLPRMVRRPIMLVRWEANRPGFQRPRKPRDKNAPASQCGLCRTSFLSHLLLGLSVPPAEKQQSIALRKPRLGATLDATKRLWRILLGLVLAWRGGVKQSNESGEAQRPGAPPRLEQ